MMQFTRLPEQFGAERLDRHWEFTLTNGHVEKGEPGDWAIYQDGHILFFLPDIFFKKQYGPADDQAWAYMTGKDLLGDQCRECGHDFATHDTAGNCEISLCGCSL